MKNSSRLILSLIMILVLSSTRSFSQQNSGTALDTYKSEPATWMKYSGGSGALYDQIAAYAEKALEKRNSRVSELNTSEDWEKYISELKYRFRKSLGDFEKTPLNAVVTGTVEREDFSVEKVVYESLPGFYVTGCLMIPRIQGQEKLPAVIVPTGHSQAAFRRDVYQNSTLNLVKKGFIVFTYDPIGQGERIQYPDDSYNHSYIGGSTFEHSYAGAQCLLTGYSISDYFIWDGIRAIDYLYSRPEVDTARIGMTGVSGGGTQTAFISAVDERIHASAPECYITSYSRLFESIGPQDAEQNLYKGLAHGFEHADLLIMRAPKPTLVISTTQDFFSIQGARETFAEAREVFETIGDSNSLRMIEADGVHGSKKENRQGMYSFFRRELDLPGDTADLEVDYLSENELVVTPTGQVSGAYNSKSVFDLNRERAVKSIGNRIIKNPAELYENKDSLLSKIRELSGFDSTRRVNPPVFTGKVERVNYVIEKYFVEGVDFEYPVPFVIIKPYTSEKRPLLLYLDPGGKNILLENEKELNAFIDAGFTVLAPDLIGTGELENTAFKGDSYISGYSFNLFIGANLAGKSIAGMQASDLDVLFKCVQTLDGIDTGNITALVNEELCSSYLHYAVFNPVFKRSVFIKPLISYEDIITTRNYEPRYLWTAVPEAVQHYDLPYLLALLAPQELVIVNPVTARGDYAAPVSVNEQLTFVRDAFKILNLDRKLRTVITGREESSSAIISKIY